MESLYTGFTGFHFMTNYSAIVPYCKALSLQFQINKQFKLPQSLACFRLTLFLLWFFVWEGLSQIKRNWLFSWINVYTVQLVQICFTVQLLYTTNSRFNLGALSWITLYFYENVYYCYINLMTLKLSSTMFFNIQLYECHMISKALTLPTFKRNTALKNQRLSKCKVLFYPLWTICNLHLWQAITREIYSTRIKPW